MAYFRNNTVNLLNLHYGIHAVAMTGGGVFYSVYLLKAGVLMPGVLVAMAAILLGRFLIRPSVVPLAVRVGLRPLVIAGTGLGMLQYLVIPHVHGIGWPLALLCFVSSLSDTVYWSTYHAYFAALGDSEHRGHQTSMREAITALVGIASPLVTGWALVAFGAVAAFGVNAFMQVVSALPLFFTPQVIVARQAPGAFRASLAGVKLFFSDGWMQSGIVFVWQIALFLSLGENFLNFGGALAIAGLVGAIGGLFLGRHIDAGQGDRAVLLALGVVAIIVGARAASLGHPALAVLANALTPLALCLYTPTLMTAVYNLAKRSPCTLRFHVATEGGWDFGGAAGCLTAAALLYFDVPISVVLLLPLIGVVTSFVQLRGYYAANPTITDLAPIEPVVGLIER
jgi:hypothetical protein